MKLPYITSLYLHIRRWNFPSFAWHFQRVWSASISPFAKGMYYMNDRMLSESQWFSLFTPSFKNSTKGYQFIVLHGWKTIMECLR